MGKVPTSCSTFPLPPPRRKLSASLEWHLSAVIVMQILTNDKQQVGRCFGFQSSSVAICAVSIYEARVRNESPRGCFWVSALSMINLWMETHLREVFSALNCCAIHYWSCRRPERKVMALGQRVTTWKSINSSNNNNSHRRFFLFSIQTPTTLSIFVSSCTNLPWNLITIVKSHGTLALLYFFSIIKYFLFSAHMYHWFGKPFINRITLKHSN